MADQRTAERSRRLDTTVTHTTTAHTATRVTTATAPRAVAIPVGRSMAMETRVAAGWVTVHAAVVIPTVVAVLAVESADYLDVLAF